MCAAILKFVWFADEPGQLKPVYREQPVEGELGAALERIKPIACEANFRLGQMLGTGGLVLATVAPGAVARLSVQEDK